MGKIQRLDETTVNQIAAGEVIENPSSVVKELAENAIDAGAAAVTIEIKGGGRQLIRISDDGCGMEAEDALLSLERHATSKITLVEDILAVKTMGFRGEALPSIASISKFTLLTSPGEGGTLLIVDGGRLVSQAPAARSRGTTIEVKQLFFNVPARKKFQRSPAYDSSEVLKCVSSLAMANPSVKFELIDNQETVLTVTHSAEQTMAAQLSDRIYELLGGGFLSDLCPIEWEEGPIKIEGFIGYAAASRPNRSGQYLFVNKRAVSSPLISHAVRDGYGSALPANRHPLFVLHLTIPGDTVDVNVHPQKREVRFRHQEQLREEIAKAVGKALHATSLAAGDERISLPTVEAPPLPSFAGIPWAEEEYCPPEAGVAFSTVEVKKEPPLPAPKRGPLPHPELVKAEEQEQLPKLLATIPGYIIASPPAGEGGIWLIDQRSAHCRVIYERLEDEEARGAIEQQPLLLPYTLDLGAHEAAVLKRALPSLNKLGIQLREFGAHTFAVDALPQVFGSVELEPFLKDLLAGLNEEEGSLDSYGRAIHKRIASAASRNALSSREKIAAPQAEALIKQLFGCRRPYQCPLGRSTVAKLSQQQLSKQF